MKKNLFILSAIAVSAAALVSCEKEQDVNVKEEPQGVPFEIVAGEIETKTVNDDNHTNWVAGDQINLFHAVSGEATYNNDNAFSATASGASVSFSGTLVNAPSAGTYNWYAVYPYNAGFDTPAGTATITIPAAQTQAGNDSKAHLAGANCPVAGNVKDVAFDDTPVVAIEHLTTIIKVHVTNKIASSITVSGVSFTAPININGAFNLDLTGDHPAMSGTGGSKTTALTVTSGSALATDASADFFLAVKPFGVTAGDQLSLTVNTSAGNQTLTTVMPSGYTFEAGKIATLNFNFTNKAVSLAQFKYSDPDWLDAQSITKPAKSKGTNISALTQTVAPISFTSTDGTSTATRVWNTSDEGSYDLRVYAGATFTLTSTSSYIINKITLNGAALPASSLTADNGTYNDEAHTWTGFAQEVVFSSTAQQNISTITVFYQAATASDYILFFPVKTKSSAYDATSTSFTVKSLNLVKADITVKDALDADATFSFDGSTLTITHPANALTTTNNLTYKVSCAKTGLSNETLTITQDAAPSSISSLTTGSGKTAIGKVAAVSKKGLILADDTAAIFVYSDTDETGRTIGDIVQVSGTVAEYNTGLQFGKSGLSIEAASGSITYSTTPTVYNKAAIDAFLAAEHNEFADLIQFTGVVKKDGSYYNIIVGGGETPNVTLFSPLSTLLTGVADGDNVTITGYAYNITSSKCCVIPTIVANNETTPKIVFSDITGVAGGGVNNATLTVTPFRIDGWTPSVTRTGCVLDDPAPTINPACTTVTYSVGENPSTSVNATGTIVVTFTKAGEEPVSYTINVTQNPNLPSVSINMTTQGYTNEQVVESVSDAGSIVTVSFTLGENTASAVPKYYTSGTALRVYQYNYVTFTSAKNIVKIEITTPGNSYNNWNTTPQAGGGTITKDGVKATWSGKAKTITIKNGNASRIRSMVITYENE